MHYWNRFVNLLTMCRKAGKLALGFDSAKETAAAGSAGCLLYTEDVSEKTRKEVLFYAEKYRIPAVCVKLSMTDMQAAVGRKCGVMAVCDQGFAKALTDIAKTAENEAP